MKLFQGGSRLARSRGNVNISDRFIGPTDLLGLGHPTIFQGGTHQITSPKAWQPQDYIPNSTRQQGILPQITFHKVGHSKPPYNVSYDNTKAETDPRSDPRFSSIDSDIRCAKEITTTYVQVNICSVYILYAISDVPPDMNPHATRYMDHVWTRYIWCYTRCLR